MKEVASFYFMLYCHPYRTLLNQQSYVESIFSKTALTTPIQGKALENRYKILASFVTSSDHG